MKFWESSRTGPRNYESQKRDKLSVPEMCRLRKESSSRYPILNIEQPAVHESLPKIEHRCSIRDATPQTCKPQTWSHIPNTGIMLTDRAPGVSTVPNRNTTDMLTIHGSSATKFPSLNKTRETDKVTKPVCFQGNISIGKVKTVGAQPQNVKKTVTPGCVQNQPRERDRTSEQQLTNGERTINIASVEKPVSMKVMHIPTPPEKTKEPKTGKRFKRKYKQKESSSLMTENKTSELLGKIEEQGKISKLLGKIEEQGKIIEDSLETDNSDAYNALLKLSNPISNKRQILPEIRCNGHTTEVETITTIVKIKGPRKSNTHAIYDKITIDTSKPIKENRQVMGILKPILPSIQDNRRKQDKTNLNNIAMNTETRQSLKRSLPDLYTMYARQN